VEQEYSRPVDEQHQFLPARISGTSNDEGPDSHCRLLGLVFTTPPGQKLNRPKFGCDASGKETCPTNRGEWGGGR